MENEMSELKNKETKITQMKKIKRQKLYFNLNFIYKYIFTYVNSYPTICYDLYYCFK